MLRQLSSAPSKAMRLTARASSSPRVAAQLSSAMSARAAVAAAAARPARPFAAAFARHYSSEAETKETKETKTEAKEETAEAAAEKAGEPLSAEEATKLRAELEAKSKEVVDWKDKYLRSVADFRNLQERTKREVKQARDFAITQFAKDLVDSVDNLDRALSIVPDEKLAAAKAASGEGDVAPESPEAARRDLASLVEGVKMTEAVLLSTLKKHGLERFDPAGEKFNPNEHEATFMTPNKDHEHNTVFFTQQKGFRLNGRVLRAAKVGVVNNK